MAARRPDACATDSSAAESASYATGGTAESIRQAGGVAGAGCITSYDARSRSRAGPRAAVAVVVWRSRHVKIADHRRTEVSVAERAEIGAAERHVGEHAEVGIPHPRSAGCRVARAAVAEPR